MALTMALVVLIARDTDAHKAVTSPYDYNKDVFPLLRDRCGRCHIAGGPAPMSLMTYKDAVMWAESIRDELTTGRMPPWPVDARSPAVAGGRTISSREIDTIVTWASGGTPHGDLRTTLPAMTFSLPWKLGPPDLTLAMDGAHTVSANTLDETCDFSLPTGLSDTRWVKAVDLMPGTASIVRDAIISVENGPVLALWQPGGDVTVAPSGDAFRLPAGSKLHLQIHYKKNYLDEQNAISDRSTIGVYFAAPPASDREIQSLAIDPPPAAAAVTVAQTFGANMAGAARVLAIRPMLNQSYASLSVTAVTPSGNRTPLLKLRGPRPQWFRRYWLQAPIELAGGSTIEVQVTPLSDNSDEPKTPARFPLQIALDYVRQ
jgi:hypothetical protein